MNQRIPCRTVGVNIIVQQILSIALLFGCNDQGPPPTAIGGQQSAAPAPASDPARNSSRAEDPDWSLAEMDSRSLGSPYKMANFEIRPPSNFRFIKYVAEAKTYYWIGRVRADETYPQFMVIITELPADGANAPVENALSEVMGAIRQRRQDWSETPAEHGRINGLPFVRSSWSGVATNAAREGLSGRTMHGIVYLTIQNNQAVQIMCQDAASDYAEWLKLGASAAMSFRIAPPENAKP
jgi:hypothetical protein